MLWFPIDRTSPKALTRQVYEQIRNCILNEELKEGQRLPSTRELASNIGVSRNTIIETYEQLIFEGYLVVRPRSGTFVAKGAVFQSKQGTAGSGAFF